MQELEAKLERVRTQLRSLTVAELQSPACIADDFKRSALNNESAGPVDANETKWIYCYNPRYFGRSASPANIEMLTVSCTQGKLMIESQERYELRMKIYRSIDMHTLAKFID